MQRLSREWSVKRMQGKPGSIRKELEAPCFMADRFAAGIPEKDAIVWAKANSVRHAHTFLHIIRHAKERGRRIDVLNASGLSAGHQDFSILPVLRDMGIEVNWHAIESPESPYLGNMHHIESIERLGIRLKLTDLSIPGALSQEGPFDVVLFTEIAEHLDHSVLLRALSGIRDALKYDGILILTTPNLLSLGNRLKFLAGRGEGAWWGEGSMNMEKGLYGHIAIYGPARIKRLLQDSGFAVDRCYTFSPGCGPAPFIRKAMSNLSGLLGSLIGNSGTTLLAVASKGEPVRVPLKI